jgi:hypothetical protein
MKRRVAISTLTAAALALVIGACDDGGDYEYRGGRGRIACGQLTTCEVCTPVVGCGWCQLASGGGVCTDGPNDCPPAPLASWTWEPVGCHHDAGALADASVGTRDSGGAPYEASVTYDASTGGEDATTSKDASGD